MSATLSVQRGECALPHRPTACFFGHTSSDLVVIGWAQRGHAAILLNQHTFECEGKHIGAVRGIK
jgi:hypothetical protein